MSLRVRYWFGRSILFILDRNVKNTPRTYRLTWQFQRKSWALEGWWTDGAAKAFEAKS